LSHRLVGREAERLTGSAIPVPDDAFEVHHEDRVVRESKQVFGVEHGHGRVHVKRVGIAAVTFVVGGLSLIRRGRILACVVRFVDRHGRSAIWGEMRNHGPSMFLYCIRMLGAYQFRGER